MLDAGEGKATLVLSNGLTYQVPGEAHEVRRTLLGIILVSGGPPPGVAMAVPTSEWNRIVNDDRTRVDENGVATLQGQRYTRLLNQEEFDALDDHRSQKAEAVAEP